MREMAIRPENVPRSPPPLQNRVQTLLSFPLPAPAMHACFYQTASFQGTKHQHYLDEQILQEMGKVMLFLVSLFFGKPKPGQRASPQPWI